MENKNISLKKNFIMNALLSMSSIIFPLITFPYVSRILLPTGMGKVSFATSVVAYFAMVAQLGIPIYGVRATAGVRDNKEELSKVVHELMIINLVMCAVVYAAFFVMVWTVPKMASEKPLYLIVGTIILLNTIGMNWLFQGLEMYSFITIRSLIFKVIGLAAMFLLIHSRSDYVIYGGITVIAGSASNIVNLFYSRHFIEFRNLGNYNFRRHFRPIGILFAMNCISTIYTNLDTVMLGIMKTDVDVGYYNASVKVKVALVSVVTSLGAVLLPRASYYIKQGMNEEFQRICAKGISFVFVFALPLALYFTLFAGPSILLLSGSSFRGAIMPMKCIMPTLLFIGITHITGVEMLIPLGKEKYTVYSFIGGAVSDLIINFLLIPRIASTGAAIGTAAAEGIVMLIQIFFLREMIKPVIRKLPYWKAAAALFAAAISSLWTLKLQVSSTVAMNSFVILAISAVLFFGVYSVVLLLTRESMAMECAGIIRSRLKRN